MAHIVSRFVWLVSLPKLFKELAEHCDPIALVLLAHHAVLFHHLQDFRWVEGDGVKGCGCSSRDSGSEKRIEAVIGLAEK